MPLARPQSEREPTGGSAEQGEKTMASTTFAEEARTDAGSQGPADTRLERVSRSRPTSSGMPLRILIANHQPIVRYGLRVLISHEPDLHVIGDTDDGGEAVRLARQLRPDVVLMDLSMPPVGGISDTRIIRAELPDTHVVITSGVNEDASAIEAIRAGAAAYLLKDARIDDLLRTIRGAGAGQVALPARTAVRMVRPLGGHDVLSHREAEVVHLVAHGLANKQVGRKLGIMESTVKTYVSGILSKLGLASRTQLALYAARNGLVALDHLGTDAEAGMRDDVLGA